MSKINKRKLLFLAIITAITGSANAELSKLQKQVVADNETMTNMGASERREFRQKIWNNSDKVAQRAYNQAYKELVASGIITFANNSEGNGNKTKKQHGITSVNNSNRGGPFSISYHSGTLAPSTAASNMVGNRFNTISGAAVPTSGSITGFTADMAVVAGTNAFFSMFDQIAGTTANLITSATQPMASGFNDVTLATGLSYVGSEFLAGVWVGGGDTINVATGTVGAQGFHAVQINDIVGTALATISNMNAAIGVRGNPPVPVELMNFSID